MALKINNKNNTSLSSLSSAHLPRGYSGLLLVESDHVTWILASDWSRVQHICPEAPERRINLVTAATFDCLDNLQCSDVRRGGHWSMRYIMEREKQISRLLSKATEHPLFSY